MFTAQEKANQLKELQRLKKSVTPTAFTRSSEPKKRFNAFLKRKFGGRTIRNTEVDGSYEPYNDETTETEEGEVQEIDDLDLYVVDSEQPACFRCNQVGHFSRDCKQPAKCFNCNQPGHLARNCKKPPKKGGDGSYRPCQDYRKLNEGTVKDAFPLPNIQDLLRDLQGKQYFTKLDI
jgi:hypothetical protein